MTKVLTIKQLKKRYTKAQLKKLLERIESILDKDLNENLEYNDYYYGWNDV